MRAVSGLACVGDGPQNASLLGRDGDAAVGALAACFGSVITNIIVIVPGRALHDFAGSRKSDFLADGFLGLLFHSGGDSWDKISEGVFIRER